VRQGDLLMLAVSALAGRKVRTALSVLGVAVGCFALVASFAIGRGVEATVLEQLRRQDQLRRVLVWPGVGPHPATIPEADLEISGEMSDERRTRLREAIRRRFEATRTPTDAHGITAAQVADLAGMDHVVAVTPALTWQARAMWGKAEVTGLVRTAGPGENGLSRRLVSGRGFEPGEEAVLVSEYAAYRWGLANEDAVAGLLGETIRLELIRAQPGVSKLLALLNVSQPDLGPKDRRVLERVLKKLPAALAGLDLSADERRVLGGLLRNSTGAKRAIGGSWPVVGVYRDVSRAELGPWDGPPRPGEVVVSPKVAERLHYATPGRSGGGLPTVAVRVEHERYLRSVEEQIKAKGFETFSLADVIDQLQLNVLLITLACAFIAVVALTVSALGITNTMLMSVLERTHEIGVLKAVGARDGDVMGLFFVEGGLIGVLGAGLGLATAWLVSFPGDRLAKYMVATQTPMQLDASVFVFDAWLVFGVPLGVTALAMLAATYPARRAARLDPLEALRQR
jgi:putative ABC transport system permease protein